MRKLRARVGRRARWRASEPWGRTVLGVGGVVDGVETDDARVEELHGDALGVVDDDVVRIEGEPVAACSAVEDHASADVGDVEGKEDRAAAADGRSVAARGSVLPLASASGNGACSSVKSSAATAGWRRRLAARRHGDVAGPGCRGPAPSTTSCVFTTPSAKSRLLMATPSTDRLGAVAPAPAVEGRRTTHRPPDRRRSA